MSFDGSIIFCLNFCTSLNIEYVLEHTKAKGVIDKLYNESSDENEEPDDNIENIFMVNELENMCQVGVLNEDEHSVLKKISRI